MGAAPGPFKDHPMHPSPESHPQPHPDPGPTPGHSGWRVWRAEWPLLPALASAAAVVAFGTGGLDLNTAPTLLGTLFVWLLAVILTTALRVVHHAECLAVRFGEPYGTLIMTLSVTCIEVLMIAALMLHGDNNPTLARDAMFAVVMIVLNGLVGLALILGALRYREQSYNLQGARAYLSVIIPLTVFTLVMPDLTVSTAGPTLSVVQSAFVLVASLALYAVFLLIQTRRHSSYFADELEQDAGPEPHAGPLPTPHSPMWHTALLLGYLALAVLLAEALAAPLELGMAITGLPPALSGLVVAALVLTPESLGALRAALRNRLQRAVNISLGSVLATIGLTGPAVLAIGLVTGLPVELGLSAADMGLLVLTLAIAILTFSGNRTNVLQGAVHLILFLVYVMLIFAP